MTPAKKTVAWVSICVACVGSFEGLRTYAYRDPIGIPTVCFGETRGVRMGDKFTADQCKGMLGIRVEEFGDGVDRCVTHPLIPERKAAYTSFAYNVGVTAFCNSTLVRKENAGDYAGACDELLKWTRAAGVQLPGLVKRRAAEREMCMAGLA